MTNLKTIFCKINQKKRNFYFPVDGGTMTTSTRFTLRWRRFWS